MLDKIINWIPEDDFLVIDGFDNAIIGVDINSSRLIYSKSKCIRILKKEMSEEDALEYFDYNIASTYLGPNTPIICVDDL